MAAALRDRHAERDPAVERPRLAAAATAQPVEVREGDCRRPPWPTRRTLTLVCSLFLLPDMNRFQQRSSTREEEEGRTESCL